MQRLFDLLFSLLALLALAPLLIPVCLILRFTGEGEIFYLQERVGKSRKPFKIYKFATMQKDSPNIGPGTVTAQNDPRILPCGVWLRKTKINELPQLLNILKGDMSVIGPRPLTDREFQLYNQAATIAISGLRPGLSGIASVIFRDEETLMSLGEDPRAIYAEFISPYKGELERWFASNNTLLNYFKLIFLTVWAVVFPKSTLVWTSFRALPEPSEAIKRALHYP